MRTSTSAATAAPAAPAATPITPAMRRTIVLARLQKLIGSTVATTVVPPNFGKLCWPDICFLADDMAQIRRMGRSKAKLGTILRIGTRVATSYGVDMAAIDPCHGSAA